MERKDRPISEKNYLLWLSNETETEWWHDSGDPAELAQGKAWGAKGVTTNPVLTYRAVNGNPAYWSDALSAIDKTSSPAQKAQTLTAAVVRNAAWMFDSVFDQTGGQLGYVCAQLNPALAADREAMIGMAERFSTWAPNVSVKFPCTAGGLDALEECVARGICATSTVSFTVSQVIAAAESYRRGKARAAQAGKRIAPCFAVVMIGRLDDYLRDVVLDRGAEVSEQDIRKAGLAVVKRAYEIFRYRGYEAKLLIAALRGTYHMEELCGANLIMSIHPKIQKLLVSSDMPRCSAIGTPVDKKVIRRLQTIPEFIKAYAPEGMNEQDFITFGATQKTLSQFSAAGWSLLEQWNSNS